MSRASRTIKVNYLARVEGEGALRLRTRNGRVTEAQLRIFEPPRFFEAFLRGRSYRELPDITARICGICPVAYQMSACHAVEAAFGVTVTGPLRALRRLLYCGEWIESHALHVLLLHAPDFLGYPDGIALAKDHPELIKQGLELKKTGNALVIALGGREIHPVNVCVGGFYAVPSQAQLRALRDKLERAREIAQALVAWTGKLPFPAFERDYEFVALRHPDEYPFNEGRLASSKGLDIAVREFETHLVEEQVRHSTALQARLVGRGAYLVGPSARYNVNFDRLLPAAQEAARAAGLGPVCRNPFQSIVVRSVEILQACEESLRILAEYEPPDQPAAPVCPRAGTGQAATEAPRGLLYHRYRFDERGDILDARIVPPTAQNQRSIELDLAEFATSRLDLPDDQLQWQCEQVIRNHDPCISCATHYLRLTREEK